MNWIADAKMVWRLGRKRSRSVADYQELQRFLACRVWDYLARQRVTFAGARLLDLAAAWGAYGQVFADAGAQVTYLDLTVDQYVPRERRPAFVKGDAVHLPFESRAFDFVFCASLIEHVPDAAALLVELYRVLRPGGRCYVGFPPFYSPAGGHQFKPFHLLGEGVALRLKGGGVTSYATSNERGGLHRRTIRGVQCLIGKAGFEVDDISTRFTALNVARLPWLGEVLTWYVQFLVRRPGADADTRR
jgi:SAM-dependent methyltransferase